MSNVTIDRCQNVIINVNGVAQATGFVVVDAFKNGGSPRLMRGVGGLHTGRTPQFETVAHSKEISVNLPLSVEKFIELTGWTSCK